MPPHSHSTAAGNSPPSIVEQQIASSNATAHAFLGGRQLSWMAPGTTTRKPNPRPAFTRQPVAQAVQQQPIQAVLPSPAPSDEPSPSLSNALDSPNPGPASLPDAQTMGTTTPSTSATLPVTEARFVHFSPVQNPEVQEAPRPATMGPAPAANNRPPSLGNHPFQVIGNGTRDRQDRQDRQGRSLSFDGVPSPTAVHRSLPPHKRRRTDQPSPTPSKCDGFLANLEQHIQSCGGEQALNTNVEKPRVLLLREACKDHDVFFLVVHQLFSIWSQCPQDAYQALPESPIMIDGAFAILETILKKNQFLSPALQHWFARFPAPGGHWARGPAGYYSTIIIHVAGFLTKLVKQYESLTVATSTRKYPFLVDELVGILGCYSPVLQLILFTACRRRLGVPDGPLGSQMEQAFHEQQKTHRGGPFNHPIMPVPMTASDIEQLNANTINYYKGIVEAATFQSPTRPSFQPQSLPTATNIQHQAGSTPYSMATPYPSMYPSAAMPAPSPVVPSNVQNFYGAHQGATIQIGSANNAQMPQQPSQRPSNLAPQYRVPSVPNQQLQQLLHCQTAITQQQQRGQEAMAQRQQQLAQQQNEQHYQLNSQAVGGFLAHPAFYTATQSAAGVVPAHRTQPAQNTRNIQQMQQLRPIQRLPQIQTTGSPARFTANGAHHQFSPQNVVQRHRPMHARDPLIPPLDREITRPEYPYDPSDRKAIMMSLHQAHVRSPKRIVKDGETERFYQAIKSFPVGPAPVAPKNTIYEFHFEVTEDQLAFAATKSKTAGGLLPVVEHFSGALRWRVRCCVVPISSKIPAEQQWVTLDVNWPPNIFMTFNEQALDIRRHPHNGRDLPTEITDFLVCGTNILKISLPNPQRERAQNRFIAVELVETLSHSSVIDSVWAQGVIPKEVTLKTIKQRLTSPPDDDGVVFEEPDLSIDLADPFSATIFKVPARGAACTHMECFDLETWLNTRPSKPLIKCPHSGLACACPNTPEPSNPDKWRCPICSKDARPYNLRIDGFLLAVRLQLEEEGKLQTKNMRVKADGSWTVVVEEDDEDSDDDGIPSSSTAGLGRVAKPTPQPAPRRPEVEVIEID